VAGDRRQRDRQPERPRGERRGLAWPGARRQPQRRRAADVAERELHRPADAIRAGPRRLGPRPGSVAAEALEHRRRRLRGFWPGPIAAEALDRRRRRLRGPRPGSIAAEALEHRRRRLRGFWPGPIAAVDALAQRRRSRGLRPVPLAAAEALDQRRRVREDRGDPPAGVRSGEPAPERVGEHAALHVAEGAGGRGERAFAAERALDERRRHRRVEHQPDRGPVPAQQEGGRERGVRRRLAARRRPARAHDDRRAQPRRGLLAAPRERRDRRGPRPGGERPRLAAGEAAQPVERVGASVGHGPRTAVAREPGDRPAADRADCWASV